MISKKKSISQNFERLRARSNNLRPEVSWENFLCEIIEDNMELRDDKKHLHSKKVTIQQQKKIGSQEDLEAVSN